MESQKVKCTLIGDSNTGKSYFLKKLHRDYIFENNYDPTVGVDFSSYIYKKTIDNQNKDIRVNIWDLAGDPRFDCIIQTYLRKNNFFILFCNKYDLKSVSNLNSWIEKIRYNNNYDQKFFISIICYDFNKDYNPIEYKINNFTIPDYVQNYSEQFSNSKYNNGSVYHLNKFSDVKQIIKTIVDEYLVFLNYEENIIDNQTIVSNNNINNNKCVFSCIFDLFRKNDNKFNLLN